MLVEFLDILVSTLELLYQLRILRLEELPLSIVGSLTIVEIFLILQYQSLPPPVLGAGAEQPHDVPVRNIRALLLLPGRTQLVQDNPAVDGQPPDSNTYHMTEDKISP